MPASANPVARRCSASSPGAALRAFVVAISGVAYRAAAQLPSPRFPVSWGHPPQEEGLGRAQDSVPLAGGYGFGSSALSTWILRHIERDNQARDVHFPPAFGNP